MAMRVLGLRLESVMCSGYSGGIWGCSLLAASHSVWLRRILSPKLGPFAPALGALASSRVTRFQAALVPGGLFINGTARVQKITCEVGRRIVFETENGLSRPPAWPLPLLA